MHLRTLVSTLALCAAAAIALAHTHDDADTEAPRPVSAATGSAGATGGAIGSTASSDGLWCFRASRRDAQASLERALSAAVSAEALRTYHDHLSARPHRAGSEGDAAVIASMRSTFEAMGLEVHQQDLDIYLAKPVSASVELSNSDASLFFLQELAPEIQGVIAPGEKWISLPIAEPALEEDPFSADEALDFGWNAWSGTGEATAEVVYANYGRKQDFERLKELGVDVTGKIVVARYGGNYRGYKAKFAEDHGAAGLLIYYDPKDVGYSRGLMYPEGGWANEHSIQRGSLLTMPYEGDPLSPGFASVPGAKLLDPAEVALPTIPVQPIGWGAAQRILRLMDGPMVPEEWQGGLPFNYHLTSGPDVQVRLKVEQVREITRTANVTATLRGAKHPDEFIVIGCHHDAWNHGAADPVAGLILIMETARIMADLARAGHPPDRTIVFAAWAAEEYGLMGSTEWVEANLDRLRDHCIAYVNLDMAAMGPHFHAASSPSIARALVHATKDVPQCGADGVAVFDRWSGTSANQWPSIGTMGGGSDHVGFLCLAGVPCMGIGAGGSPGTSYHTNYDTLTWYRKIVGDDYEPAVMVGRAVALLVSRMANADAPPVHAGDIAMEVTSHLRALAALAGDAGMANSIGPIMQRAETIGAQAKTAGELLDRALEADALSAAQLVTIADAFRAMDRAWVGPGLPDRPWFKSRFMAPDRDSGYASWPLPEMRAAIEERDAAALAAAERGVSEALDRIAAATETIRETCSGALGR